MEEIDKRRKAEFRTHEMEKEHKRRMEEKSFDDAKKKAAAEERQRLRAKHLEDAKKVNHPVREKSGGYVNKTYRTYVDVKFA